MFSQTLTASTFNRELTTKTVNTLFNIGLVLLALLMGAMAFAGSVSGTLLEGTTVEEGLNMTIQTIKYFLYFVGVGGFLAGIIAMVIDRGINKMGVVGVIGGLVLVLIGTSVDTIVQRFGVAGGVI